MCKGNVPARLCVGATGNPTQGIVRGDFSKTYDGWSSFKRLSNNEPPLAQEYSNPKKVKLTPEVWSAKPVKQ